MITSEDVARGDAELAHQRVEEERVVLERQAQLGKWAPIEKQLSAELDETEARFDGVLNDFVDAMTALTQLRVQYKAAAKLVLKNGGVDVRPYTLNRGQLKLLKDLDVVLRAFRLT